MSTTDPLVENLQTPKRKPDPYSRALEDLQVALKALADKHGEVIDGLLLTPLWRIQSPQLPNGLLTVPDPNTADLTQVLSTASRQSAAFLIEMTEEVFSRMGERIVSLEKQVPRSKDNGEEAHNKHE